LSKHKLLLADDSKTIQKVISLTFEDAGFEVYCVDDGNAAIEQVVEIQPDIVMADVTMPGLSGYEVCRRIKQTEATRHIPVVLLVGTFEPFDEGEAMRVGAADHLTKPFQSIQELAARVNSLLERGQSAATSFDDTIEFEKAPAENIDDQMIQAGAAEDYADDFEASERDTPVELDETNLLELPPRDYFLATLARQQVPVAETPVEAVDEETSETETAGEETFETETVAEEEADKTEVAKAGETSESSETEESSPAEEPSEIVDAVPDETAELANLSPEMIDAIAAKVVEKISDRIVREMVPQMTDLIVKRMSEEKAEE
jgi:CheY-like chemotaxis protein